MMLAKSHRLLFSRKPEIKPKSRCDVMSITALIFKMDHYRFRGGANENYSH
jgi:hypothetical protein